MVTATFLMNPLQAQAVLLKSMIEMSKEMQDITIGAVKRAGQRKSSPVEWVSFEMPVPDVRSFIDEDVMRATFHRMADQNLRGWEVAADLIKTLPSWVGLSSRVPGTVMTDWFDQMRRASEAMMPANDAWAVAEPVKRTVAKPSVKSSAAPAALKTAAPAKAPVPIKKAAMTKSAAAMPKTTIKPVAKAAPTKPASPKVDGPERLDAPRGKADDLTAIKGIGEKLSSLLNTLGIYHYSQIASWTKADSEWIDRKLAFKGRVAREKWVQQAKSLNKKAA